MSEFWAFILGVVVGVIFVGTVVANSRRKRHVPTVLGSAVPLTRHTIDFSKRYNISTGSRFGEGASREFHSVRIVGYVEKQEDGGGKFSEDWIVAELPDVRKLYLTPQSIQVMEVTSNEPGNA